ncbi:MAG TPA: pyridoxal-dependent decarboxylase [Myxococcaceae bacterium]|nr:pyridoxal-dependent decarboxylase [Myxococcaceae bacterium]
MTDPLAPYFLGAYGENNDFFEKTLLELVRDHVFWRRNFHPEDEPPIGTHDQYTRAYLDGLARTRHELHQLTAALKRSIPSFHPRYLGHMVSDLLLPGLVAQLVTTLYNPNNIVEDVAPITVQLELEVGRQLATMLGFSVDPATEPCALGHLTSGGTVANDEALRLARSTRLYPLALRDASAATGAWVPGVPVMPSSTDVELLALGVDDVLALARRVSAYCAREPRGAELFRALAASRVEETGLAAFVERHPGLRRMAVVVPGTAHYSWHKAVGLLGLGGANLVEVPVRQARLDGAALERALGSLRREGRQVLAVVGVYGTTEFGTLDSIHELLAVRRHFPGFWLHVDAAWGGYLPTLFRDRRGQLLPRETVREGFHHFPSERVYRATRALAEVDSVTVDPHKLGFVPFGAGALVVRNRRVLDLVQQEAPYVFASPPEEDERRYRKLGRYILEGSKPGAAAAACYVNHRVLPLDHDHFGRLLARSVQTCERLADRIPALEQELAPWVRLAVPFEPDCNLVCLAFNPVGNRSLKAANAFGRRLFETVDVRPDQPVQLKEFFGSSTTVRLDHLGPEEVERIGAALQLDLARPDDSDLFLLRHTLMNPWLQTSPGPGEPSYVEAYFHFLSRQIRLLLESRPARGT